LGKDVEEVALRLMGDDVTSIEEVKKLWAPKGLADGAVEIDDVFDPCPQRSDVFGGCLMPKE
jgi:hypothetical protein